MKTLKIIIGAVLATAIATSNANANVLDAITLDDLQPSIIVGGVTAHLGDKYAPKGGYNALNYDLGVMIETKRKGFNLGLGGAGHLDSFGEVSFTGGVKLSYKVELENDWEVSPAASLLYTHMSYYEGLVPAVGVEVCKGFNCINTDIVPPSTKSDGIVHVNFKRKF